MFKTLIKPAFADLKTFVLDTLFPIECVICKDEGSFICADCKMSLKTLDSQRCIVCQKQTPFGLTHSGCLTPHGADGLISFYDYHDDKVAKIIIAGKYYFLKDTYSQLALAILPKLQNSFDHIISTDSIIVPIPLHSTRKRWRGFNQAEILSAELSRGLKMPVADPLVRKKITKTQKDLKKADRGKNIEGAFALKKSADIRGKEIILVDDVATTGATLLEAAKVLKRNGAAQVICLTIARD
jgi:competence protein ComFC